MKWFRLAGGCNDGLPAVLDAAVIESALKDGNYIRVQSCGRSPVR